MRRRGSCSRVENARRPYEFNPLYQCGPNAGSITASPGAQDCPPWQRSRDHEAAPRHRGPASPRIAPPGPGCARSGQSPPSVRARPQGFCPTQRSCYPHLYKVVHDYLVVWSVYCFGLPPVDDGSRGNGIVAGVAPILVDSRTKRHAHRYRRHRSRSRRPRFPAIVPLATRRRAWTPSSRNHETKRSAP